MFDVNISVVSFFHLQDITGLFALSYRKDHGCFEDAITLKKSYVEIPLPKIF